MDRNVFDILMERGFIEQTSHEDELRELLGKEPVTFYCGYDPTADSLTAGHFLTLMAISHMQKAGHRPIILIGGGTTMVGDPTGKTDMRKMLTLDDINNNAECFKEQMKRFIDFEDDKAIMDNNADWLMNLEYLPFLREIGAHFSVNRMLSAECYKSRMEKGLTFLEFNYMIMQSYDFLELNRKYECKLQVGGNDQWSNMLGGIDLIRKKEGESSYVMTFTLLTTPDGKKMGKTEDGALWLDPKKTTPYDFYQYWRNVDDKVVEKCLALLTFLPMDEVRRLGALEGSEINKAKEVLAFEVTKIVHGEEEAKKSQDAAKALFTGGDKAASIPSTELDSSMFDEGMGILALLTEVGLTSSNGEARRLVKQGGVYVNEDRVTDFRLEVSLNDFEDGKLMIRKGKKVYHQVIIK
ncbi:tyrosine--tRNA ligase [Sporosalibacterium faouarense]|uniref:tyrosine--tRNA ligase n=1 Tax=Sporosalibacterium faouarense TaxID=516123 RepID=UPI00192C64A6|nr:tyrosine--tRNA ligase [Sporosalibacterium faouarense]